MIFSLLIAGCSATGSSTSSAIYAGDYAAIVPYETSDTRVKHIGLISSYDTRKEVETGLMDLSKQYFSPNDVAYKTHTFLDYDELDATDGSRGLLGTLRDDNPNGLNPGANEEFDTGNGIVIGPVILVDIYELDFYQNSQLKGVSIGLVVTKDVEGEDGEDVEITPEKMENYLEVTSSKLVSYMRERFNAISTRVPIFVAAYELDTTSQSNYGGYIFTGYFNGNNVTYNQITQSWVLVPSTSFSSLDPVMAGQFTTFKEDMAGVLVDNTYVTGKAKFENGECIKLNLDITAHAKTAGEILAVVQMAKETLSVFDDISCTYKLKVINNNDVYAVMERDAHSNQVRVISMD